MALGDLFGKKKKDLPAPGPKPGAPGLNPGLARGLTAQKETPNQMVARMKAQGMNQQQIVAALSREGYSQTQIYDAIDTSSQMGGQVPSAQPGTPGPQPPGPLPGPGAAPNAQPGAIPPPMHQPPMQPMAMPSPHTAATPSSQVDELIEKTVQEKWHDFTSELKRMEEFKGSVETRLSQVESQLSSLDQKFDQLKNAIIAKIKDYDTSILNVGTEMKAMEQVFQKILPELQQNVSELSRVTGKISTGKRPAPKK